MLRHAPAGSVPNYDFLLPVVSWSTYDPNNTIDPAKNFYGDFINYNLRVADLRDAATAGAKAVLFYKDLPTRQIRGHIEPYEGERWRVGESRIHRALKLKYITPEQAKQFREQGAIGSHLENLERNEGFKGFNQKGVSEIIAATDPRKQSLP